MQSYFLGGKYPEVEEAAQVALVLETVSARATPVRSTTSPNQSGVARRKARIVLVLLKRHGLVREHRGGGGSGCASNLTRLRPERRPHRLRGAARAAIARSCGR